jgi:hypothetical protein
MTSLYYRPSSYFKAHTGSKQEWYDEAVHAVLLEEFPVRGAFSEIFTSHELYCYKLKAATKEMLCTVLSPPPTPFLSN